MTAQKRLKAVLAAVILTGAAALPAAASDNSRDILAESLPVSLSGSYLAARSADTAKDLKAASTFFGVALSHDPQNPILLERVLLLHVANGEIDIALSFADRLVALDPRNPVARLVRGVKAIRDGDFSAARSELAQSAQAPLAVLTGGLLSAWASQGEGRTSDALDKIRSLSGPSWYGIFKDYHTAIIADLAGDEANAERTIRVAFETDGAALRVVEAYGRILARAGRRDEAIAALAGFLAEQPTQPLIRKLLDELKGGMTPGAVIVDAKAGAADVLYGLGSAIGADQGPELPAAYLRLARYIQPDFDLAAMALGDILLSSNDCEEAIAVYGDIPPDSLLRRNADIQTGLCLDQLDRTEEAAAAIGRVIEADPSDLEAVMALGNIWRGRDKFPEAAEVFSRGIATIAEPKPSDWRIYYFRGVALERSKRWPEAEADLKKALELNPEQPLVLNYLGYSWVDMHVNLDEGLEMIQNAVEQRPTDGYIVDSLGWAYYRLGRYEEAVTQLERAVELKPEDPVINDHLGDAYWMVGRKREAVFQWSHARDLDPEPADLQKIVKKLENGMEPDAGNDG